jgi:hypothetical protein
MNIKNKIPVFVSIYDMKVDGKDFNKVHGVGIYHSGVQIGNKV